MSLLKDPYFSKSCVPANMGKTVKAETGGWGSGIGNNVSATMRGVNAVADTMAGNLDVDKAGQKRHETYAAMRKTPAYKALRKKEKHAKYRAKFGGQDSPTLQDKAAKQLRHTPGTPVIRLDAGSCDVALQPWQLSGIAKARTMVAVKREDAPRKKTTQSKSA